MSTLRVNDINNLGLDDVITNGVVEKRALPSGSVLQVVSTTKTDTFSSTSTSFADVTGLSVSITPGSTSSKILVMASIGYSDSSDSYASQFTLARDGINLSNPTSPGSRTPVFFTKKAMSTQELLNGHISFLDSPSSIFSLTYNIRVKSENAGNSIYVNRDRGDTDVTSIGRGVSTITLMEIAG